MTKANDTEYRDVVIKKVEPEGDGQGWAITSSDGWSFFVPDEGVEPHVGDTARFYGRGIGSIVRGLDINGQEVFYRTPEEQEEENKRETVRAAQKQRDDFEQNRERLDAAYGSLPVEFQQRIAGFRERNPNFRWEYESYEMMVCVDANEIAKACTMPETGAKLRELGIRLKDGNWIDNPVGRLNAFAAINSEANQYQFNLQDEVIPGLDKGHSGNSFGAALRLAYLYLERPDLIAKEHGALCPLVGCQDYGCYATIANAA
jgi:hypothetical protein